MWCSLYPPPRSLIVALPPLVYMGNDPLPMSTYLQLQADNGEGKSSSSVTCRGGPKAHLYPELPSGHLSLSLANSQGGVWNQMFWQMARSLGKHMDAF